MLEHKNGKWQPTDIAQEILLPAEWLSKNYHVNNVSSILSVTQYKATIVFSTEIRKVIVACDELSTVGGA